MPHQLKKPKDTQVSELTNNPVLAKLLVNETFVHNGETYPVAYSTPPQLCKAYADLVRQYQLKRGLEIGTNLGLSTLFLAEAIHEQGGQLTTVDLRP